MSRRADLRTARGGFALVEALASLAIVGMTSLMILAGVSTGRRVWESMDSTAAAGEAVEGAQAQIRGRLERMFPADSFDGVRPLLQFDGRQTSVTFLAPPTQAGAPDAVQRFSLVLAPSGELLLISRNELAPPSAAPAVQSRSLLRGVRTLDLAYFGAAAPDNTLRWRSTWQDQTYPPRLVRVRVGFAPGDRRRWPDLVVRPEATVDSLCVLYVAGGRCLGRS